MTDLIQWGILGAARINRSFVPSLLCSKQAQLAAIASRSPERAREQAARWKIPRIYASYEELLADPSIDAVYIPLPNHLHKEWAVRAALAGKHVLVEKPLALSEQEVDEIIIAAAQANVFVTEGMMHLHHRKTAAVRQMLTQGVIGDPLYFHGEFTFPLTRPDDYRLEKHFGGGSLWDVGCYLVSYARILFGDLPQFVQGFQVSAPAGVDRTFSGILQFEEGQIAHIFTSFDLPRRRCIEIRGTQGSLLIPEPFRSEKPTQVILKTEQGEKPFHFPAQDRYLGEIEDLQHAILTGEPPSASLEESRLNIRTIDCLLQSVNVGTVIKMYA
jgi:xylose dehydrogenase (NAD/NADP)